MKQFKGKELINRLLRKDLSMIKDRASRTPDMPIWDIIIVPAWREIRFCYIHGLDWAVVLLSAALLEYAVKDRAFGIEYQIKGWAGRDRKKYIKEKSVEYAIKKCLEEKVISIDESKKLKNIGQKIRDQSSHMNILKIGENKIFPKMPMIQLEPNLLVPFQNVKAEDNPIAGKFAFWEEMNHLSIDVIVDCYNLLLSLYKEEIKNYNEGKIGGCIIINNGN